jgi:cytidine deaminase
MITEEQKAALISSACEARSRAYARYSRYEVGAAVLTEDGQIYPGANVENSVYGLTICAERAAVFTAVSAGQRRIIAVAVCTQNAVSPCGSCRQVLSEFADDIPIWLVDAEGNIRETSLDALLPEQFGPEDLPAGQ